MDCRLSPFRLHGGSSIDLPFSPPPPTVSGQPISRTATTPSFPLTTTTVAFCFLNANISDKCSPRNVIVPVRSHQRGGRGGQALCRGRRDRKGLFRHSLQGIPLGSSQYSSSGSLNFTQTTPVGNSQASRDKDRQQEQAHHKAF